MTDEFSSSSLIRRGRWFACFRKTVNFSFESFYFSQLYLLNSERFNRDVWRENEEGHFYYLVNEKVNMVLHYKTEWDFYFWEREMRESCPLNNIIIMFAVLNSIYYVLSSFLSRRDKCDFWRGGSVGALRERNTFWF